MKSSTIPEGFARNRNEKLWIITAGRPAPEDFSGIVQGPAPTHVRAYRISELARYMIMPGPVEIKRRLVGCEVHRGSRGAASRWKRLGALKRRGGAGNGQENDDVELVVSAKDPRRPPLEDPRLENLFAAIDQQLKPYDPTVKRLTTLETDGITDIVGTCEDLGGNRSTFTLRGSVAEKLEYVIENINRQVAISIRQSQIAEGLFDISGFDLTKFRPDVSYPLLRIHQEGKASFVVLNGLGRVDFTVEAPRLIGYLQVLQQSLDSDEKLVVPLLQCMEGEAHPLRLFFNTQLTIDYSGVHIPAVYRQVLREHPLQTTGRQALLQALGAMQLGVAFNYVPRSPTGEEKLYTNLSVMHDMKALEPIRNMLPQIYSEIKKRVCVSDIGRFYLLDSIKGYTDEFGLQSR